MPLEERCIPPLFFALLRAACSITAQVIFIARYIEADHVGVSPARSRPNRASLLQLQAFILAFFEWLAGELPERASTRECSGPWRCGFEAAVISG